MTAAAESAGGALRPRRVRARRRPRHADSGPPGRSAWVRRLVPFALVLLGIVVFVYPVVATQYNNVKQQEFAQRYGAQVSSVSSTTRADQLAAARDYNASINGIPILDPWLTKVSSNPNSEEYDRYLAQLDETQVMARLQVPSIGVDLPIRHGTSDKTLAEGVGHLYGTSLPVGGKGTHSVLTSHTGLSNATLFDNLVDVKEGDVVYVEVMGETLAYEVDQLKVVLPHEVSDLVPSADQDYLTLITCTPYAVNSHRLLVRGHRVPFEAAAAVEPPAQDGDVALRLEPWMWWLLAGAGAGLLALGIMALSMVRRARRLQGNQPASPGARDKGTALPGSGGTTETSRTLEQ